MIDKDLFISAIGGSFIGYLIYSFIKGLTKDFFYRMGFALGSFIGDIIELFRD